MSTSKTIASESLPLRLFTRGTEPEFTRSLTYYSGLENLPVLSNQIPPEDLDEIRNGPLGVLLRFYDSKFLWSARIVHELLVNQLVTNKKYEFWTLYGGQAMRFSLKEFKIITGLNCEPYPLENMDVEVDHQFWRRLGLMDAENQEDLDVEKQDDMDAENQDDMDVEKQYDMDVEDDPQFWRRLGLMENKGLSYSMIEDKIMICKEWGPKDRIRLVYLFLVFRFLLGRHPGKRIASKAVYLVLDREKFEAYPWGRVAFHHLLKSVFKAKPDLSQNSYGVNGFVQVLQVWAYEAIPTLGKKCGNFKKNMMEFPPLLRWKGSRKRFRYDLSQNKEQVFVKGVMDNNTEDVWVDEEQDLTVDNMFLQISGSSGKIFEKQFWKDKGLLEGPKKMVEEEDGQAHNKEGRPLKKKNKDDVLKTYFVSLVEQMTEDVQKSFSTLVDGVVKKLDSRMGKMEEGIKEIQERSKNIETRMDMFEVVTKGVEDKGFLHEERVRDNGSHKGTTCSNGSQKGTTCSNGSQKGTTCSNGSQKGTTCSNKPSEKKSNPFSIPVLKDISVQDLPTDEDSVDCEVDSGKSQEQVESRVEALSETSSLRDRNMKRQLDNFVRSLGVKKKPIDKEKRSRKPTAKLKSPFTCNDAINKILTGDRPRTAYDPFKPVKKTLVTALSKWIIRNVTVPCGSAGEEVGNEFFTDIRTPRTHIGNEHIDAAMALFRRRSLMSPCPYRGGRIAFMDTGFTVAIGHNYKEFKKDPKKYTWKSGAINYYTGMLPSVGCTHKQLGKDVDDIYVVIHIKPEHWAALAISIPKRTIHVYDSIIGYATDEEMEEQVQPYAQMIPYMLKAFAPEKEKRMSVAKYKISKPNKIPQNVQTGDCGIYAIKYIECLALKCEFKGLDDAHIKEIRAKLAAEIFDESKNVGFY